VAFKLFQISPSIYQSERTHTLSDEQVEKVIMAAGITHIVNLWHTPDTRLQAFTSYLHVSLPDGKLRPELIKEFENASLMVELAVMRHGKVLVHCWGGKNRSGLVNGLALMRLTGMTGNSAYEQVRAARRGSLFNEDFANYLRNHGPYPYKSGE
jgi:protein-tyrosine phosphatase